MAGNSNITATYKFLLRKSANRRLYLRTVFTKQNVPAINKKLTMPQA
jgi:hypothetical protein